MDLYMELTYWIFQAKVWVILGLALVIVDVFLGTFFILPIGIAAFIMSGLIFAQNRLWFSDFTLFETWRDVAIAFAILSVVSIGVVKLLFQNRSRDKTDINEY